MATDVLAQGDDTASRHPERRGVYRTGLDVDGLQWRNALHRRHHLSRREAPALRDDGRGAHGFGNRVDPAYTATGGTRDAPPPFIEPIRIRLREPHSQLDAVVEIDDIERTDIVRGLHDPLSEAEPDREIRQILRRAHHHGISAAIIGDRDRGLFRNGTRARAYAAVAPDLTINRAHRVAHSSTPRLPRQARCAGSGGLVRRRPSAIPTGRWRAISAPP
ncbi:hypothetical protein GALL_499290 [mine drainage metagenome]|uniref:Uncharacterized protein n=1 Tax=mine drainage metagenome TaxID=410659 RepID=A0A1J5PL13_9ZZZZ